MYTKLKVILLLCACSSLYGHNIIPQAADYISVNEGRRNKLYRDSKGLLTIGIGHLVTSKELVVYTGKTLTDKEINDLFNKDINSKLLLIKKQFGDLYDSYPDGLKIAILDGYFRGDLPGSPKTINLLKSKKFKEAAKEYLNNAEYREAKQKKSGVAKRMEKNAKAMLDAF